MQYGSKNISKVQYGSKNIIAAYWGSKKVWENVPLEDLTENYCTIEALEDGLTVSFSTNTIQYSTDNCQTWNELTVGTTTPAINSGDMISFKATGLTSNSKVGIGTFTVNKKFNLKGNVMSMLFGDDGKNSYDLTGYDGAFVRLFIDSTTLQSVSKNFLPATTLSSSCYSYMFQGCTSLTTSPELPATTLSNYCYYNMFGDTNVLPDCTNIDFTSESVVASGGLVGLFSGTKVTDKDLYNILPINPSTGKYWLPSTTLTNGCYYEMFFNCTSLTTSPELPATTLSSSCYSYMFQGCTSLTTSPELPATTLTVGCYDYMFAGCTSLTTSPKLPATTLANGCYNNMFAGCTSLITAPKLPATTLANSCYRYMFYGCTSLVTTPSILPATEMTDNCYQSMFYGCTSLTTAPELPATTMSLSCYSYMFQDCTSLVTAPELPATTIAGYCYSNMFRNCTSLTTSPELPATTLAQNCYQYMFYGCTSLVTAPELPATTLDNSYSCYSYMFYGCTSLVTAPELPATTLENYCYQYMFQDCTSLVTAPELPATTLAKNCYQYMFRNCTSLNYIKALFTTTPSSSYTNYWVSGVSSTGTFVKNAAATWDVAGVNGIPEGWTVKTVEDCYLTIEALEDELTVSFSTNTIQYSTDNCQTWNELSADTTTPAINTGDKISFKATGMVPDGYSGIGKFTVNKNFNLKGNVMSMLFGDEGKNSYDLTGYDYAFLGLFNNCSTLQSVSKDFLPATTLSMGCYLNMFKNCGYLTTSPELPATTLTNGCYYEMFTDCTSLTTAPSVLPATTLTEYCYLNMFKNCTSLVTAPELHATTLIARCYAEMFDGCTSLTTAPSVLPATTLVEGCYANMFRGCTSLVAAPELPATTLASGCYSEMFYGCTSLTTAPSVLPATTLVEGCYYGMFRGCTSLVAAPELPATTLASGCYINMFTNCSSLNYIKALFTTEPIWGYTSNWVEGVSPTGTFVKNAAATWDVTGVYGVPEGWTIKTIVDDYLTVESLEDGLTVSFSTNTIQYSTDNCQTWNELPSNTTTPAINSGDRISFKANGLTPNSSNGIGTFTVDKKFNLKGNVMSMLFGDEGKNSYDLTGYGYTFYKLFYNCTTLQSVSKDFLPATTLSNNCYSHMFSGCTSLVTAPELPATTLADYCYSSMFDVCKALVVAPTLPAITLAPSCYNSMFRSCSSLTIVSELPATTLAYRCYFTMLSGCSSLKTAPEISATTVAEDCCIGMFYNCTKLTTAPSILPSTTLSDGCYDSMFHDCRSLVSAPELPATTLAKECYHYMFLNCKALVTAPELPATTLANSCYAGMFGGCTSLVNAPALPATTLANSCYYSMFSGTNVLPDCTNIDFTKHNNGGLVGLFAGTKVTDNDLYNILPINPNTGKYWLPATTLDNYGYQNMFSSCSSLTTAPELPATTLTYMCYRSMFSSCTSLVNVPELPATTLADRCYESMFYGCTSLTTAPELPAITLTERCYYDMFRGCTSLVTAPDLPATILVNDCYYEMFRDCSSLNYIKALFTTTPYASYTSNWVNGVSSTGTFVKNVNATWDVTGVNGIPEGWTLINTAEKSYLTIEALEDNLTVSFSLNTIQYSTDYCQTWNELPADTTTPAINTGDMISFKATGLTSNSTNGIGTFTVNKKFNLKGNVMSMLFGDEGKNSFDLTGYKYAFYKLFNKCTTLQSVSKDFLPATTLTYGCYKTMFSGCTSLTTAPELPATTLSPYCYYIMFSGCTSLVTAPELPATTFASSCYAEMFSGCTSLTTAPTLPSTTLSDNCYRNMFYGCTSLTVAPELPATTLDPACYQGMFYGCTSLVTAPELPATTLDSSCYKSMFSGCTSLVTAPELPAITLSPSCYSSMFFDCSSLVTAPELPATTLVDGCYIYMFTQCSKLNYIKALFTTEPSSTYTNKWVTSVSRTGTFVKNAAATWDVTGVNGIPDGWTVETTVDYLTIEALEDDLTVSFSKNTIQYSTDNCQTWNELPSNTTTPAINSGDRISFKANGLVTNSLNGIGTFTVNKNFNLKGNVMSMLFGDEGKDRFDLTGYDGAFLRLFNNCTTLQSVSKDFLPATTLTLKCYSHMFSGCTSLVTAPSLPDTTLADQCYDAMFTDCTSLVNAPELPATELTDQCYRYMFAGCTSLVNAPELPATTLVNFCYFNMFNGCSSLNYIKALFTTTPSMATTWTWVSGVSPTGTFVKNANATWNVTGDNGVPEGWTVETYPKLITFTINNVEYQSEEGMTWGEWVNSEYNTIGYCERGSMICNSDVNTTYSAICLDYNPVNVTDEIIPETEYKTLSSGSFN